MANYPFRKVLFISHEATRTGAPLVLLHLLTYLKQHTDWQCRVLFLEGGEAIGEFEKLYPCDRWESSPKELQGKFYYHARTFLKIDKNRGLVNSYRGEGFDLIYANSVVSLKSAVKLKEAIRKPIISHIHELGFALSTFYQDWLTAENIAQTARFIVVSNVAAKDLTQDWPIAKKNVSVINSFIDIQKVTAVDRKPAEVLIELGFQADDFIVGNCGMSSWWKGTDIFIQVAAEVNRIQPNNTIKFIWIGHEPPIDQRQTKYDMERLPGQNSVFFIGRKANPSEYMQLFHLFFMTSRADSLGIASIEAALLGKPIMCFEDCGGIVEFVDDAIGYKMPYLDIRTAALQLLALVDRRTELAEKGKKAAERAKSYDVTFNAPKIILTIVENSN